MTLLSTVSILDIIEEQKIPIVLEFLKDYVVTVVSISLSFSVFLVF